MTDADDAAGARPTDGPKRRRHRRRPPRRAHWPLGPRGILAIAAAVVAIAVAIVVAVVIAVVSDGEPEPPPTVVLPDLRDVPEQEAVDRLDELGIINVEIARVQDPGLNGVVTFTDPPHGTEIDRDRQVNLIVAIDFAAPHPMSPVEDEEVAAGQPVTLEWEPVDGANNYRIEISVETCDANPDPSNPAPLCAFSFFNGFETDDVTAELPEEAKLVPTSTGRIQWTVVAVDDFGNAGFEAGTASFRLVV
ncbi:MAG: PASTA domain-containing protein [Acidimicrobiales bacterium]